tara:strand:+ start:278 stop:493 length:216 start_codon:yes stop_codon:yes gene_type:complete
MKTLDYFLIALIIALLMLAVSCTKEDDDRCINYLLEQEAAEPVCVDGICTIQYFTTITCSFNETDRKKFTD